MGGGRGSAQRRVHHGRGRWLGGGMLAVWWWLCRRQGGHPPALSTSASACLTTASNSRGIPGSAEEQEEEEEEQWTADLTVSRAAGQNHTATITAAQRTSAQARQQYTAEVQAQARASCTAHTQGGRVGEEEEEERGGVEEEGEGVEREKSSRRQLAEARGRGGGLCSSAASMEGGAALAVDEQGQSWATEKEDKGSVSRSSSCCSRVLSAARKEEEVERGGREGGGRGAAARWSWRTARRRLGCLEPRRVAAAADVDECTGWEGGREQGQGPAEAHTAQPTPTPQPRTATAQPHRTSSRSLLTPPLQFDLEPHLLSPPLPSRSPRLPCPLRARCARRGGWRRGCGGGAEAAREEGRRLLSSAQLSSPQLWPRLLALSPNPGLLAAAARLSVGSAAIQAWEEAEHSRGRSWDRQPTASLSLCLPSRSTLCDLLSLISAACMCASACACIVMRSSLHCDLMLLRLFEELRRRRLRRVRQRTR